jgi:hypothetical protein
VEVIRSNPDCALQAPLHPGYAGSKSYGDLVMTKIDTATHKIDHPKVFISYSHDSHEHMDHVLTLSDLLRREGVDCHIDQYEMFPPEGWPRWMMNQIENANFVLIVCTETYNRRFRGKEETGKGVGVKWEGAILTQGLYDAEAENTRFIPILFSSHDSIHIPIVLRGAGYYDLDTEEGYENLYRYLTNQPRVLKPNLGEIRPMQPLKRKQDFLASKIHDEIIDQSFLIKDRTQNFVGRQFVFERIKEFINKNPSGYFSLKAILVLAKQL